MELREVLFADASLAAHHDVGDDLDIVDLQDEKGVAKKSLRVLHVDDNIGLDVVFGKLFQRRDRDLGGRDDDLPPQDGIQRRSGRAHADVADFTERVDLDFAQRMVGGHLGRRLCQGGVQHLVDLLLR